MAKVELQMIDTTGEVEVGVFDVDISGKSLEQIMAEVVVMHASWCTEQDTFDLLNIFGCVKSDDGKSIKIEGEECDQVVTILD